MQEYEETIRLRDMEIEGLYREIQDLKTQLTEKQIEADTWYRQTKDGDVKYAALEIDYNECKQRLRYVENLAVRRGAGE